MWIGSLRYRITIQDRISIPDGRGGSAVTWQPLAAVWAGMQAGAGDESEVGAAVQSRAKYTFVIRSRSDVRPDQRVVWKGRTLNIIAASVVDQSKMSLECEEVADDGQLGEEG